MEGEMDRRKFIFRALALFPALAYAAHKPDPSSLLEGVTPKRDVLVCVPSASRTTGEWPNWQYGDYIRYDHELSTAEIEEGKALCLGQAKAAFAALQVPDASDKVKFIVHNLGTDSPGDPWQRYATIAWKVSIPAPQWQWVLQECNDKPALLKQILRTRKRHVPISLNGNIQMIPHALVRDYLRHMAARS